MYSSSSITERVEKPLLRLLQRIQTIIFTYLKRNVKDKRTRSLYDLESSVAVDVVNFATVQRMLRDGKFYIDMLAHVTLNTINVLNIDASRDSLVSGNVVELTRIKWQRLERCIAVAILTSGLPELTACPKLLNSLKSEEITEEERAQYETIIAVEPLFSVCLEVSREQDYFEGEEALLFGREKAKQLKSVLENEAAVVGAWRKTQSAQRSYDVLTQYAVTSTIPQAEQEAVMRQLDTSLPAGFRGPAYNFDDGQLTEEWMCSFKDKNQAGPSDDDVIKVLTGQTLEILLGRIEDRVCTELKILDSTPLNLDSSSCCERLVWGIDCACRRLVEVSIRSRIGDVGCDSNGALKHFVERRLLPAINAQDANHAHNMLTVALYMSKMPVRDTADHASQDWSRYSPSEHRFSLALLAAVEELGIDLFRIHPKGTGVICTASKGIPPHRVVCEYLGELYPPYRWCERMDVLKQAQRQFHLKPTLPDFYNILLERPRQDPNGYGLLYVDAAQRSNIGSTLAHSCDNNCTSAVVSRNGQLTIVLTSSRYIMPGEEITHDYSAVTPTEDEWRASVCLCGMLQCRGRFLHYSDEGPVQRILEQHCGPLWRYAALLKACSNKPLVKKDTEVLNRHGMHDTALGYLSDGAREASTKLWMQRFAADMLRFIEHERAALPCALLRNQTDFISTFSSADWDARTVMEQRIQSLCCAFSMVQRVLQFQPSSNADATKAGSRRASGNEPQKSTAPLSALDSADAAKHVWSVLKSIPSLLAGYAQELSMRMAAASNASDKPTETMMSSGEKKVDAPKRLQKAAKDIASVLQQSPPSSHQLAKDQCRAVRLIILEIQDLADRSHRLRLLADILALWAHTSYFSRPCEFMPVQGTQMTIFARELGNSVPRSLVEKQQQQHHNSVTTEGPSQKDSPDTEGAKLTSKLLHAEEPVYVGQKNYDSKFIFWQLMQWFNAGSEKDVSPVDIFGSLQLPEPHQCFGSCEGQYGDSTRHSFFELLRDEKAQALPWPAWLKTCFSTPYVKKTITCSRVGDSKRSKGPKNKVDKIGEDGSPEERTGTHYHETHLICGSPMLDVSLGLTHAVRSLVMEEMPISDQNCSSKRGKRKRGKADADGGDASGLQPDDTLPPEDNTSWVQCDLCHAWRRLPWNIDANSLGDGWQCASNTWDKEKATCNIAADTWDPTSEDITDATGGENNESLEVNASRDVYCLIDEIYYEATVVKIKPPGAPADPKKVAAKHDRGDSSGGEFGSALFKFKYFGNMYREWIPCNSDRIRPLHMFSDTTATSLEQAQEYQGLFAQRPSSKKRRKSKTSNPFVGEKARTSFSSDGYKTMDLREIFR